MTRRPNDTSTSTRYVRSGSGYVQQRKDLRDAQPYLPPGHTRGFDPEEPPLEWRILHNLQAWQLLHEGMQMAPLTSLYVDGPHLNPMMGWCVDV